MEGRHQAREAALQMLYQWELGGASVQDVLSAYRAEPPGPRLTPEYESFACALVEGTIGDLERIDPLISASAEHWRLQRMAIVDRMIIRLAVHEFLRPAMPKAVVINEAVELARTFGSDESVKFVNGLLDAIARRIEETEGKKAESEQ
jgi:N utilization substance protein B